MEQGKKHKQGKQHVAKSTNYIIVVVRQDRVCKGCGKIIPKGTRTLTVSTRSQGRCWYCMKCANELKKKQGGVNKDCWVFKQIMQTHSMLENLPFDDEGAHMAFSETLEEYKGKCLDCNRKCEMANRVLKELR